MSRREGGACACSGSSVVAIGGIPPDPLISSRNADGGPERLVLGGNALFPSGTGITPLGMFGFVSIPTLFWMEFGNISSGSIGSRVTVAVI